MTCDGTGFDLGLVQCGTGSAPRLIAANIKEEQFSYQGEEQPEERQQLRKEDGEDEETERYTRQPLDEVLFGRLLVDHCEGVGAVDNPVLLLEDLSEERGMPGVAQPFLPVSAIESVSVGGSYMVDTGGLAAVVFCPTEHGGVRTDLLLLVYALLVGWSTGYRSLWPKPMHRFFLGIVARLPISTVHWISNEHDTFGPVRTIDCIELLLWMVYDPVQLLAGVCCCHKALFTLVHCWYLLAVLCACDDLDVHQRRRVPEVDEVIRQRRLARRQVRSDLAAARRRGATERRTADQLVKCPICRTLTLRRSAVCGVRGIFPEQPPSPTGEGEGGQSSSGVSTKQSPP